MRSLVKKFLDRWRRFASAPVLNAIHDLPTPRPADVAGQLQLKLAYRRLVEDGRALPSLADVGFKTFSQTDEDGILLFLFAVLGSPTRRAVEVCAGNGVECNAANLIVNHGWDALLVDGDASLVERGRRFYAESPHTYVCPPRFACSWITRDGINKLVADNGFAGEIDLLSLDLDGVDYWIWEALDVVTPRVVVVEYQDILGPERAWTVPYADDFSSAAYPVTDGMPNFAGASLAAFVKLGRRKGYRLVGINRYGYNAFFVKNGVGDELLPEIDVASCFAHRKVVWGMQQRFPLVKDLPWVEV